MEEIAFNDWPGQPVDLATGGNPWLPAYGFQAPPPMLEREDFIGNPGWYSCTCTFSLRPEYTRATVKKTP